MEFFLGKINPEGFLHMFSLGAVSSGDHQRLRISPCGFSADPVPLSPSPWVCGSLFSKASAPTPNSSHKGQLRWWEIQAPRFSRASLIQTHPKDCNSGALKNLRIPGQDPQTGRQSPFDGLTQAVPHSPSPSLFC